MKRILRISFLFLSAVVLATSFQQLQAQTTVTITSSGTWTVPAGVTSINLYLWGGGGGGGGSTQTSQSFFSNGGGGGGGACAVNTSIPVIAGQVWTVTIGSGGSGSTGAGGTGGTTTFVNGATTYSAVGGAGGSAGTVTNGQANSGGAGGNTGTGTVYAGGSGSAGNNGTSSTTGITGTGGGSGGSAGAGTTPASACSVSGTGGGGAFPGGTGGYNTNCNSTTDAGGVSGAQPGGGGSGNNDWTTSNSGGNGGAGEVIVTYISSVITINSSTTWTVPAGITSANLYLWGGGGGGGGSTHTTQTDFSNGGGGGGGACSVNSSIPVTPGQVWTITIGAAGVGSTGAGGPGGTTTFVNGATTYSAGGGAGGTAGTTATGTANAGGAGGSTGTGTVHSGGTGSAGNNGTSNTTGITGTGGGAGGSGANGTSPASACSVTGTGGTGTYTGGNGGYEPDCGTSNNSSGTAGSVPGGGGSGNNDWSSATSGGAGGAGQVVIDISFTCTAPTTQSSVFTSSAITASSMTAGWTRGNGNDVLVLCSAGSACNTNPTSGTAYTANAVYGSGTGIGNAFVVYNGTGTSVNVTGLSSSTTYYYAIYEYNTLNNCYDLTADLTGNATTSPPAPPSTQASNLTFLNVDCQSMTISWTNGNGGGRYVVMNTSNTFTPPTNGTPPTTPNSVWANAGQQVVFDGNTSSVTVTSLSTSTLYWFKVYEYNGSGATINYSVAVGANNPLSHTSAGFVAAPTTSASGVNFSATACNQTTVAWTNGNGTGRIVVAKAGSAVAGVPVNGGAYTAASAFGLGSTIAAGEYVVYSGTGSNVTVTSLSASTTYYFAVFEDDGTAGCESYKTAAPGTNSVATPSCVNQIPYMTSAVINACPGSCGSEGANELLFFSSGSYAIPVNAANMVLTYGSAPAPTKIYNGVITANATITANLNAAAGCTGFFIDAVTAGTIPANTNFIMTSDTYCDGAYDFSSLCSSGYGPVYMVYADPTSNWYQVSGSPTGNYANAAGAGVPRYFRTDFSAVTGGGTSGITDYSYISSSLACDCDGATCTWGPSGGAPLVYVTPNSCTFPMIVLPIELASFTGTRTGKNVRLDWVTQTETNNAFFTLERSTNGTDFTYVAQVKGAGNSSSTLLYSYTDDGAPSGVCYYRLKQTDFNGDFTHSHDITVKPLHFFSVQSVYPNPATQQLNVSIEQESSNNMVVSVYNAEGKRVYMAAKTLTDKSSTLQIDLSDFPAGIYLLTVKGADTDYQSKFIKQ